MLGGEGRAVAAAAGRREKREKRERGEKEQVLWLNVLIITSNFSS